MTTDCLHIAACGMNCSLCMAFHREKRPCFGCNTISKNKPIHCQNCTITNCEELSNTESHFCYSCTKFPCKRLKQLDARYRKKYGMSMIENLLLIKQNGIDEFCTKEEKKWTCSVCGNLFCVHKDACLKCGNKNEVFPSK